MSKLSTLNLASLIINCVVRSDFYNQETEKDNELKSILLEKDVEKLAYWLQLHSFLKYKLDKILAEFSEINIEDPNPTVASAMNDVIFDFLKEKKTKHNLPKFAAEDFSNTDYVALSQEISNLDSQLRSTDSSLREDLVRPLLNAKTRRNRDLSRPANMKAIGAPNYASEYAHKKLVKAIAGLMPGDRQQILYYHFGEAHAFGFDVERTPEGKLKIFSFESVTDPKHLHALQLLHDSLTQLDEDFEIRSCNSFLQKDGFNCATYTYAVLSELSKYDHVYDYLPEVSEEDSDVTSLKGQKISMRKADSPFANQDRTFTFEVTGQIRWVRLCDMPTKIISMGQSHTEMEKLLKLSPDFDLDPAKFVEMLKEKYQFIPSSPQITKYINRRREHIASHIENSTEEVKQEPYQRALEKMPLLAQIDKGQLPDFNKEIIENKSLTLDEKIKYIKNLFLTITMRRGIRSSIRSYSIKEFSEHEINVLILLRNEYLRLLGELGFEHLKKVISDYGEPIFHNDLDTVFQQRQVPAQPLSTILREVLNKGQKVAIYRDISEFSLPKGLKIHNPFISRYEGNPSEITAEAIDEIFSQLEEEFRDPETGISFFDAKQKIQLIKKFFDKCGQNEIADLTSQQIHAMFLMRNQCIRLLTELIDDKEFINYLKSMSFYFRKLDTARSEFVGKIGEQLDPSIKSSHAEMEKHFSRKALLFIDNHIHESYFGQFITLPDNPLFSLINTENFTKEKIVKALEKIQEDYRDIEGQSRFTLWDLVNFIDEASKWSKDTKTREELKNAYLTILSKHEEGYKNINFHGRTTLDIIDSLIGHNLSIETYEQLILARLNTADNLLVKLTILDAAFLHVAPKPNRRKIKQEGYTQQQLRDINVLRSVYMKLIQNEPYDRENTDFNSKLKNFLDKRDYYGEHNPHNLIDLTYSDADGNKLNSIRSEIDRLSDGESRPIKQIVIENDLISKDETSWISFSNLLSLMHRWLSYFIVNVNKAVEIEKQNKKATEKGKEKDDAVTPPSSENKDTNPHASCTLGFFSNSSSKQTISQEQNLSSVINSFYTSSEALYRSERLNVELNRSGDSWIQYNRLHPDVGGFEDTWKLNFAILKEDLPKAFEIMATIAQKNDLACFKVMTQNQAKIDASELSQMFGREMVVYCGANPEFNGAKWIEIINEIEFALDEAGVRPSRDSAPSSNRSIGKYTSYTHHAWTTGMETKECYVPFDQGIKETGLEDEDLFKDYNPSAHIKQCKSN